MDAQFWIKAWNEGRTNFHTGIYHTQLTEHFPRLNPQKGQKVLVPLCGKTKDLIWLHERNLHVHGVELHDQAVKGFFSDNKIPAPQVTRDQDFTHYTHNNITISCGDFFKLDPKNTYDLIYDRAALVALPSTMRQQYAQVIKRSLKTGGKCLLITYEYEQSQMEGPPFSVDGCEIHELYQDRCTITLLESKRPKNEGPRLAALETIKEKVYLLEKKTH